MRVSRTRRYLLATCLLVACIVSLALPLRALAAERAVQVQDLGIAATSVAMTEEGAFADVAREDDSGRWSALVSRTGEVLFPFVRTSNNWQCSDGVLTQCGMAARPSMEQKLGVTVNTGYYNLDGSELFGSSGSLGSTYGYDVVSPYGEGLAVVRGFSGNYLREVRTMLINRQGEIVLSLEGPFTRGIAFGEGINPDDPSQLTAWSAAAAGFVGSASFSCGLIPFYSQCSEEVALHAGQHVSEFVMPEEGFNRAYNNNFSSRCGYMDKAGNVVIGMEYASALSFSADGLAQVKELTSGGGIGKVGYIDTEGNLVVGYRFDSGTSFYDGLACVRENGAWGVIDAEGNTVVPFEYDDGFGTGDDGLCTLGRGDRYGLVSARDGSVVVPFEWDDLSTFRDGVAYGIRDGELYAITLGIAFSDVTDSTPHCADIRWLADSGISVGWSNGDGTRSFRGMSDVARQDMAAFLYRLAGLPDYTPSTADKLMFVDVDDSTPHCEEIWWLAKTGISEGWLMPDGTREFRGMSSVVRQDMAAFLRRLAQRQMGIAADLPSGYANPFADVDSSTPHCEDILWLASSGVSAGWTEPDGTRTFRGMNPVVRQDMAAFLHRLDGLRQA